MRDIPLQYRRRTFIKNLDDYNNDLSTIRESEPDYYNSLKEKHCPGCCILHSYNAELNHLICTKCGFIRDLNNDGEGEAAENDDNDEDDQYGATKEHSNARKNAFAEENNIPAIIPMGQRRTTLQRVPEWSHDGDVKRLADKGYQIKSYSEIVKGEDGKTLKYHSNKVL